MNALRTIRTIIVEDDPQVAEIQRRFLEKIDGIELVGIAHSMAEADDLVDIFKPDLALLDVHFPEGNGLDLLRQWRADHRDVDVILITAANEVDTLRSALHAGVFEFILKPLVLQRLVDAIERFRSHLTTLEQLDTLDQSGLDTLIIPPGDSQTGKASKSPTRLPKGIDALTLETIEQQMQSGEALTAEEVGQAIGSSRTTARRYLEYLVGQERLRAEVNYGTVGRPERRYRINA
ncbi:response regulator [Reinekea blandensis]|uniref:Transcriptional regulatory protein n=1 Tax=Reinekea blandensis MED297 TaxID=314283 RepID=A4BHP1_9GAMM|nr:response regulator [Reinekea blandensis]EAR08296.1 hypothetical Response regulator ofcitrate/malate metabolism [Reinekea sp. MED297] [Reinekea blandensis MED297]